MAIERRTLVLALALTPGIGSKTLLRVLTRNDVLACSPKDFLKISPEALAEEYHLNAKTAQLWSSTSRERIQKAQEYEHMLDQYGVTLLTAADAGYPEKLESFDPDPPGVLFVYGNLRLFSSKTFCVLSSRHAPPAAMREMEVLTEQGVMNGEILICGHDRPEYKRAAIVPLRWGAPRIMVLDRGLFIALGKHLNHEPFKEARLWRYQFDPRLDLVVSSINPEQPYHPRGNRIRDRLIAALSDRLDFVWLREKGNMWDLAEQALRVGRQIQLSDLIPETKELQMNGGVLLKR